MIKLIIILYCAFVLWVVMRVIRDNRPAITTLAWVLFLVCIPVIGLIIKSSTHNVSHALVGNA